MIKFKSKEEAEAIYGKGVKVLAIAPNTMDILNKIPEGWKYDEGVRTAPFFCKAITNGLSRFTPNEKGELHRTALIIDEYFIKKERWT